MTITKEIVETEFKNLVAAIDGLNVKAELIYKNFRYSILYTFKNGKIKEKTKNESVKDIYETIKLHCEAIKEVNEI